MLKISELIVAVPLSGRQQGVALITAMLVVALATITVVAMVSQQQHSIRRAGAMIYNDQAYQYALGVEDWARGILAKDLKTNHIDSSTDLWAKELPETKIAGGVVKGRISDLQGRFNLNNLVQNGKSDKESIKQFRRLLRSLMIDKEIDQAIVDWLDADTDVQFPNGAEDDIYSRKDPPYLTANRPMQSVSEIRLVAGIDAEIYQKLMSHISALPEPTPVNINTASAAVLTVFGDGLDINRMESLAKGAEKQPWKTRDDFFRDAGLTTSEQLKRAAAVSSHYFRVKSDVRVGHAALHMVSRLQRTASGEVTVFSRNRRGGND